MGGSDSTPACTAEGENCTIDSQCCGGGEWKAGKYTGTHYCEGEDTYNLNGLFTGKSDIETCILYPSTAEESFSGQLSIMGNDYELMEVLTYLLALVGVLAIVWMLCKLVRKRLSKSKYMEVEPVKTFQPIKTFQTNVV